VIALLDGCRVSGDLEVVLLRTQHLQGVEAGWFAQGGQALVVSVLDAFLSASIARSMAAANSIIEEFLTVHELSVYPIIAAVIASPITGYTSCESGVSRIISRSTFST
jgi:hypothetical protein